MACAQQGPSSAPASSTWETNRRRHNGQLLCESYGGSLSQKFTLLILSQEFRGAVTMSDPYFTKSFLNRDELEARSRPSASSQVPPRAHNHPHSMRRPYRVQKRHGPAPSKKTVDPSHATTSLVTIVVSITAPAALMAGSSPKVEIKIQQFPTTEIKLGECGWVVTSTNVAHECRCSTGDHQWFAPRMATLVDAWSWAKFKAPRIMQPAETSE
ncbi:hypothetical protein EDB80DRAFT_692273 [Ilyonectria destructans]|nr:hypothetical protein EDB80DRAFT_692273 [Ilyonectria destructans]